MKSLIFILLLLITLVSQYSNNIINQQPPVMSNYNYEESWKKVSEFEGNGLPESALKIVNEIYEQAKKEGNASQLVKAIIHIMRLTEYKEESSLVKNMNRLRDEIEIADFPVKPLLHSMLAEAYWNYYINNRYRFDQRSQTVNFNNGDITTWSLEKIVEEVLKHYTLSLEDAERSKSTRIELYDDILDGGNTMGRAYRPTLYDFLAHRAVDYFTNQEPDITKPAYAFNLSSADYLSEAEKFCNLKISTKDTLSHKYHALKIFQELIRLHRRDSGPDALTDVDLKRLRFVYQNLTLSDKQELYLKALEKLEQETIRSEISTRVTSEIAGIWVAMAGQYNPLQDDAHKWDAKKAWDICDAAIMRFPDSDGAAMCRNLQNQILTKSVSVRIEKVSVPGMPFRALVNYQNFTDLHYRIIKVSRDEVIAERKKYERDYNVDRESKFLEHFTAKTPVKSGKIVLPDDGDFQRHSSEIALDAIPAGDYMVLVSFNPLFSVAGNNLNYAFITMSNLSYIHRNLDIGSTEFCVLDRTTGFPVAGVKARLVFNKYNSKTNRYENIMGEVFTSDAEGFFTVPYQYKTSSDYYSNSFDVDFSYQDDNISTREIDSYNAYTNHLSQYIQNKPSRLTHTYFFLDRAIYRPGQTLYFKGLVYSSDGKDPKIMAGKTYTVVFMDVNRQEVAKKQVTTNEYGTFSGTFITPSAGLMGQMQLNINDSYGSNISFSVEEYKRPKFEVRFGPVKGSYRLGEVIKVEGNASAYSGANIDGAAVSYRVVRQARFPYWWWYRHGYYPVSPEMEITNGISETDAEGKFSVSFEAIPDESVGPESDPVFYYTVYADVTDINGETHSGETYVNVGYKALELGLQIDDIDISDEMAIRKKFPVTTVNLAGEHEPAGVGISIWKLKSPEKAYRERMWERPDKFVYSETEFHRLFPDDPYADENNSAKWEKGKEVFSLHLNTLNEREFEIKDLKNWQPGKYLAEISAKDKYGKDVKEMVGFEVFNARSNHVPYPVRNLVREIKTTCEPGESALLEVVSSENISALYEIEQEGTIIDRKRVILSDESHLFSIPVLEEYRGNIAVHYTFVKDNRLYHHTSTITVPYSNKQLDVSFETYRNKLQPGEKEEWKIRISGRKTEKITAEMVATLYDQSLDIFRANSWYAGFYNAVYNRLLWQSAGGFASLQFRNYDNNWNEHEWYGYNEPVFDQLTWFGLYFYDYYGYPGNKVYRALQAKTAGVEIVEEADMAEVGYVMAPAAKMDDIREKDKEGYFDETIMNQKPPAPPAQDMSDVKIRSNFNETAFFYPHLQTDENGEVVISFTIPEALTRWKMLGFAHTKDLSSGSIINELVTQKDLMVVPNQSRFFRENDKMVFSAKITSLAETMLSGNAQLEFFDALSMKPLGIIADGVNQKAFSVAAKQSTNVEWKIDIPEGVQAISYRIAARAGNFSDGEEMVIPVVTNSMLVTETLPLPVRGKQTKTFRLDKLADNTSTTLRNQRFTLEFTSNPAWYAVQALPYMMEYPYECVEQTFSRFYANAIATQIANSNPKIKKVFDTWATIQPDALLSNLEKNQELKSALLEETPWVLQAKDESQRKRNVALLFDINRMANEKEKAIKKIMEAQNGNGGFSWFPGLPDDRYITQHIIAGIGHLDVMGVDKVRLDNRTWNMVHQALGYMDRKMQDHYEYLKSLAAKGHLVMDDCHLDYIEIHYLYTRSYFRDVKIPGPCEEGFNYFLGQAKRYWMQNEIYMQGMMCLALHRYDEHQKALDIVRSLSERALHSEEMGMYWKTERGYYWYQAPIETHALLTEVYDEVANDAKAVEDLKVWLLKQKQVQDWRTTKATAEACYALLRRGVNMLASDTLVQVIVGKEEVDPLRLPDTKVEAGTGYFKTAWTAGEITPEMGNITVTKKDEGIAWGAVYWQYFEQLDKITPAETPLQLKKQLFLQQQTDRGPVITPVTDETMLHVGDLVKVRIELRVDRTMEYVHMKDMRAAAFEPVETLSTFKYQDGLYYYQSPRDLAVNFFIGWLPKGTYIFEYPLRVSQKGDFSNGITTIQCMYAPEFSSHSEGIRVKVE